MPDQLVTLDVRAAWKRVPLMFIAALALAGAWYGVRWLIGGTMAENAPDFETAEAAVRLAPRDPQSHLKLARLHRVSFEPEELPLALEQYEQAAALAPNDWLIWLEMGRARGTSGDTEGGILAVRRAAELAPNYAQPRWHLGNLLLRDGQTDAAFAELRRAADADPTLRPQVFNLAWQVFKQDMPQVIRTVGNTPEARAQLTTVLVGRNRLDDALALWAGLSAAEQKENWAAGETLVRALYDAKRYRSALQVSQEMGAVNPSETAAGQVTNGSFESDIGPPGKKFFDWQVAPLPQAQITVDPRAPHGGKRSLRVIFNAPAQLDFRNVLQFVVVEPSTRYRLSFYVRAEDLRSASTPVLLVFDAADMNAALGSSAPIATGTSDWQQLVIEFTTTPRTEAIMLRMDRAPCADGACPIYGKVWYDDFDLQRTTGRAAAR
ncbi:MAG: hypothetical protein LC754_03720 [Acidobacteria bacterium]|nr:hypothetical protein [Acidobacteriota bacterium]